jgi:hypothetical protein
MKNLFRAVLKVLCGYVPDPSLAILDRATENLDDARASSAMQISLEKDVYEIFNANADYIHAASKNLTTTKAANRLKGQKEAVAISMRDYLTSLDARDAASERLCEFNFDIDEWEPARANDYSKCVAAFAMGCASVDGAMMDVATIAQFMLPPGHAGLAHADIVLSALEKLPVKPKSKIDSGLAGGPSVA